MGGFTWLLNNWFELSQTVGIVGSLALAGYTAWKDERARRISNSIAISEQHQRIWEQLYERPELTRVQMKEADLKTEPVSVAEEVFVTSLILHLGTVYRAMLHGEFVKYEGLQRDVREFFSCAIPRMVWAKIRPFQDEDFVAFIEAALR